MGDHNALGNMAAHSATGSNNLGIKEASRCSHFPICFCLVHSRLFISPYLPAITAKIRDNLSPFCFWRGEA